MMRSAATIWSTAWLSKPESCGSSRCDSMCTASTSVRMPSSVTCFATSLSMKKVAATGVGSASPLVSTRIWSKRSGWASSVWRMRTRSVRTSTTQQMQPLVIW
ncbi:hypothetical protein D3C87_1441160 [compost metagenome]